MENITEEEYKTEVQILTRKINPRSQVQRQAEGLVRKHDWVQKRSTIEDIFTHSTTGVETPAVNELESENDLARKLFATDIVNEVN